MNSKKRAVVIDDDGGIRKLLKHFLEDMGYETETFATPLEYSCEKECSSSGKSCLDVLITDYYMPGMNGEEFIKQQKGKNCQIRKMAVVSGVMGNDEKELEKNLNCKFFSKPFDFPKLKAWIES